MLGSVLSSVGTPNQIKHGLSAGSVYSHLGGPADMSASY